VDGELVGSCHGVLHVEGAGLLHGREDHVGCSDPRKVHHDAFLPRCDRRDPGRAEHRAAVNAKTDPRSAGSEGDGLNTDETALAVHPSEGVAVTRHADAVADANDAIHAAAAVDASRTAVSSDAGGTASVDARAAVGVSGDTGFGAEADNTILAISLDAGAPADADAEDAEVAIALDAGLAGSVNTYAAGGEILAEH